MYIEGGFRSFHTINIGSVGQRSAKLPSSNFLDPVGVDHRLLAFGLTPAEWQTFF